jgi:hypothetical protein
VSKADAIRLAGGILAVLVGLLVWAVLCWRDRRRKRRGECG